MLIDQSCVQLSPTRRRSYAPRGCRPILKTLKSRKKISVMAALTLSPKTLQHNLFFQSLTDGNFNSARVIAFLRDLLKQLPGKVVVIWDNAPIHKSLAVRAFVKSQRHRLRLSFLPPYAPELNPVEALWSYLKYGRLANLIAADLAQLEDEIADVLVEAKHDPDFLRSHWNQTPLGKIITNESK